MEALIQNKGNVYYTINLGCVVGLKWLLYGIVQTRTEKCWCCCRNLVRKEGSACGQEAKVGDVIQQELGRDNVDNCVMCDPALLPASVLDWSYSLATGRVLLSCPACSQQFSVGGIHINCSPPPVV